MHAHIRYPGIGISFRSFLRYGNESAHRSMPPRGQLPGLLFSAGTLLLRPSEGNTEQMPPGQEFRRVKNNLTAGREHAALLGAHPLCSPFFSSVAGINMPSAFLQAGALPAR